MPAAPTLLPCLLPSWLANERHRNAWVSYLLASASGQSWEERSWPDGQDRIYIYIFVPYIFAGMMALPKKDNVHFKVFCCVFFFFLPFSQSFSHYKSSFQTIQTERERGGANKWISMWIRLRQSGQIQSSCRRGPSPQERTSADDRLFLSKQRHFIEFIPKIL